MSAEERDSMAEQRTNWAEDRTLLANERTFAGWMRTGFASVGVGIAVQAIFSRVEPVWLAKAVASIFFVLALVVFAAAYFKAREVIRRLDAHTAQPLKRTSLRTITLLVTVATAALAVLLWQF